LPWVKIKTGAIIAGGMKTLTVPSLPPVIREPDTILALLPIAVFKLNTDISVVTMNTVMVPSLPDVIRDPEALPFLAAVKFAIEAIPARKIDAVTLPLLPDVVRDPKALPVLATVKLTIAVIPARKMDTATAPPLPDVVRGTEDLPLLAAVKFAIKDIPAGKMDTLAVPGFETEEIPVSEMHLSAEGYSLLEKLEGFSPQLYSLKDGGFTIGFGFFLPYADGAKWDKGVTWAEAEVMIRQKMPTYENQVKKYINVPLTQNEFDALTMLAYNLGGFSKATSIVNDVNNQASFDKLQSDWNRFVHSKAPGVTKGLMNRRKDEMRVRGEEDYQPERKIQVLKIRK
jgi:GH24 family phage-related lysozyme (muramidase)